MPKSSLQMKLKFFLLNLFKFFPEKHNLRCFYTNKTQKRPTDAATTHFFRMLCACCAQVVRKIIYGKLKENTLTSQFLTRYFIIKNKFSHLLFKKKFFLKNKTAKTNRFSICWLNLKKFLMHKKK